MFRSTGSKVVAATAVAVLLGGTAAALVLEPADVLPPRVDATGRPTAPTASPEPSRTPLLPPAAGAAAQPPAAAALRAALKPLLAHPAVRGRLAASVVDVESGDVLLAHRQDVPVLPASTAKIATAVAALTALDPAARLTTRVVAGRKAGEVVLVGGGDPLLAGPRATRRYPAAARLGMLAAGLAGTRVTRVLVDDSLYRGPRTGPGWRPGYVSEGNVAPVSALYVDSGRVRPGRDARVADPALAAGRALAAALKVEAPVARVVVGQDATVLASVQSAPVAALVEDMLRRSDNDLAETLARQVALVEGLPPTFGGAAAGVRQVLDGLGVAPAAIALVDGSGLSRANRLQPAALTALLRVAASSPALAPALSGLPVAGFDGTLAKRYRKGASVPAAGTVRAKTGTLNGVSALAGLVRTRDGRLLAFDLTADAVPLGATRSAEAALDRFAALLAGCGCR